MYEDVEPQLEYLTTWFRGLRDSHFNPDEELRWCYAFRDADVEKLRSLAECLKDLEYEIEDLFEDDGPDGEGLGVEYILSVKKVEKHTPESLAERNVALARLASEYSYAVEKVSSSGRKLTTP
jgi:hypothetical protein